MRTVGNREVYLPELEKGNLTVVPEYAGTLTEFLNKKQNGADAAAKASSDLDATVTALDAAGPKPGLVFGKPAAAAGPERVRRHQGVRRQERRQDAVRAGRQVRRSRARRPAGVPAAPVLPAGSEKTYGMEFASFKALDAGGPLTKSALKSGQIAIGLVFSSDGSLATG